MAAQTRPSCCFTVACSDRFLAIFPSFHSSSSSLLPCSLLSLSLPSRRARAASLASLRPPWERHPHSFRFSFSSRLSHSCGVKAQAHQRLAHRGSTARLSAITATRDLARVVSCCTQGGSPAGTGRSGQQRVRDVGRQEGSRQTQVPLRVQRIEQMSSFCERMAAFVASNGAHAACAVIFRQNK